MKGTLTKGNPRSYRSDRRSLIATVTVLGLALALVASPALAKKLTGTKRSELIVGTKGADRIKGKGGNDLIKGKGGNDRLNGGKGSNKVIGGKGNDKVIGGPLGDTLVGKAGVDSHVGGAGNDLLKAADGRRDRVIDGGTGTNRCIVDVVELSIVRNCGTVQGTTPGGQGGRPGGQGPGPGPGPGQGLRVLTVEAMCGSQNPLTGEIGCFVHITGDGADAGGGQVEPGGGGVTNAGGVALSINAPEWDALGFYSCTSPGFLLVTIGSESVDVPVPCAPSPPPGS
jgi:RTX calcium-binding nonapeptide repeat (4 copies)